MQSDHNLGGRLSDARFPADRFTATAQVNRFRNRALILALVLGSALLGLMRLDVFQTGAFTDDAQYIILAESLATGQGYRLINYPQAPPRPAQPPGWPLMLVPVARLWPGNYSAFKLYTLLWWLAAIPLVYSLFKPHLHPPYRQALVVLAAVHPALVAMSVMVMSETAYLFCSLLTLVLYQRWERSPHAGRHGLLAGALLAGAWATSIRAAGVCLLLAIALHLVIAHGRRYRLPLAAGLMAGAVVVAWYAARFLPAGLLSDAYRQHLAYITTHAGEFLRPWQRLGLFSNPQVADLVLPGFDSGAAGALLGPLAYRAAGLAIALGLAFGLVLALRRRQVLDMYAALYVGVFYIWTVYINELQVRQLLPVVPWLLYYGLAMVRGLAARLPLPSRMRPAHLGLGAAGLVVLLALAVNLYRWQARLPRTPVDLTAGTTWIRSQAAAGCILMSPDPAPDYLYSRCLTVDYPPHPKELEPYLEAAGVRYIIIKPHLDQPLPAQSPAPLGELAADYLLPQIQAHPDVYRLAYQNSAANVRVYEVLSGAVSGVK